VRARRLRGPLLALALASRCGSPDGPAARDGAFRVTGIIEGFYGTPYAHEDRLALIRFLAEAGLDHYVYAPKSDPYHRSRWRDPYPSEDLARFAELAAAGANADVTFTFAVSPTDIVFTNDSDVAALIAKLDSTWNQGVRSFTLSFDDTIPLLRDPGDLLHYGLDVARAHAELANRLLAHLRSLDAKAELFFTPMDYNGAIQPYTHQLALTLDHSIPVFWTGSGVWSPTIDAPYMQEVEEALRRPALLWDNFPANDGPFVNQLNLGRYRGRDPRLPGVIDGVLLNTMIQPRASEIAIHQLGRYAANPVT
jgi:hyaluronoglucosaminidase